MASVNSDSLRWQNTLAAICLSTFLMFYMGSSPFVEDMNRVVPEDASSYLAPGVTVSAVFNVTTWCILFPLVGQMMRRKYLSVQHLGKIAMLQVVVPLFIGLGAESGLWWLQYIGAVIGSFGFVCSLTIEKVVAIQWWAAEGRAPTGGAIIGASVGLGTMAFTILNAVLCRFFGMAHAMYAGAAILFFSALYPFWLASTGNLNAPPAVASTVQKKTPSPAGRVLRSLQFWQVGLHAFSFQFLGMGMKGLLSPMFIATYSVTYLNSAYLAASSLVFFTVARGVLPLLAGRLPLTVVCTVLFFLDTLLFALSPVVIAHTPVEVLLLVKTLTGVVYAGLATLQSLIVIEVFGAENLGVVFPLLAPASGIGNALGPMIGYYTFLTSLDAGASRAHAYNLFFYICSGLAALAGLNLVFLQMRRWMCQKALEYESVSKSESVSESESGSDSMDM